MLTVPVRLLGDAERRRGTAARRGAVRRRAGRRAGQLRLGWRGGGRGAGVRVRHRRQAGIDVLGSAPTSSRCAPRAAAARSPNCSPVRAADLLVARRAAPTRCCACGSGWRRGGGRPATCAPASRCSRRRPPTGAGDPTVRLVRTDEMTCSIPAAVAMYTEEVGVSPAGDGGPAYRDRVARPRARRRAYARFVGGRVVFKAEVAVGHPAHGADPRRLGAPEWRGRGLAPRDGGGGRRRAAPGRAHREPVRQRLQRAGPPGLRTVRLPRVGTFATVLF